MAGGPFYMIEARAPADGARLEEAVVARDAAGG